MEEERPYLKVVLVNAPVIEIQEPWFDMPDFGRTGLAYIAGYLRQYAEFPVTIEIIDAKFECLNFESTYNRIISASPDIVGFTAFTNEIKPCGYLVQKIKSAFPHIITVVGGAHITAIPVETLKEFPAIDIGVIGEGEETFFEICKSIYSKEEVLNIEGIVVRKKSGEIEKKGIRARIIDQDLIPFPAWDLLPKANTYFIQSVRGCPFSCVFCMNHNGKVARMRSVNNVMQEMEWILNTFKPKRISFGDELFSIDRQRTMDLLDAMIDAQIGSRVKWDVQTHVNFVDEQMLGKMKIANIERLEMGVETGDEGLLKIMGKATNISMIVKAFETARRLKVKTGSFLLFGQPGETIDSINKTIDLAVRINADMPMFGIMIPYPGTEVAKLVAEGKAGYKLISLNWDDYRKQIGKALEFANISKRQIEFYQILGYIKVFLLNFRWLDFFSFILEFRLGAWNVFKRTVLNIQESSLMSQKPNDYDEVLNRGESFLPIHFIQSTDDWRVYQREDQSRINKQKYINKNSA